MQNSERGKKIGNVMVSTSRNVVQTGKAVGKKFILNSFASKQYLLLSKHLISRLYFILIQEYFITFMQNRATF